MRVLLIALLCILSYNSCKNDQSKELELNDRIAELEEINKKLSDSLTEMMQDRIYNTMLIARPEHNEIVPGVRNKLNVLMHTFRPYPSYNVYRIKQNGDKEILHENLTDPNFDLEFIPKADAKTTVNYLVVVNLNGKEIEIPSKITYHAEK